MTPEELREIDKKVAVEFGATVEWHDKFGRKGYKLRQLVPAPPSDSVQRPYYTEDGLFAIEESAWECVLRFTTDPRAADLVRQEIERRGWDWYSQCSHTDNGICYEATVGHPQWPESNREGVFADCTSLSSDSTHLALCLAFLKACEAIREEKS